LPTLVLQQFRAGKINEDTCEDFIFSDDDFVAVIDGSTDKTGIRIEGRTGGAIVAETVRSVLMDKQLMPVDATFEDWVVLTTAAIDRKLVDIDWPKYIARPAASAVVYSNNRREIWRVGDCHFRIEGMNHLGGKPIDDAAAARRKQVIEEAIASGTTIDEIRANDIGRKAVMDLLKDQANHANVDGELGYPVFNGNPIPPSLLEAPVDVPPASICILCSDGIDFPHETLQESLEQQQRSYEADPLRIGLDGCRPSTKALAPGAERHDDQSYVNFMTSPDTGKMPAEELARMRAEITNFMKWEKRRRLFFRYTGLEPFVNRMRFHKLMASFPPRKPTHKD
jgi:glycerophosphoryl diester phosphodiesterase